MSWHRLTLDPPPDPLADLAALERGEQPVGDPPRWLLAGRPVRCGDVLELRLPRGGALAVRFELDWAASGPAPALYLATGVDPYPVDRRDPASVTDDVGPSLVLRPRPGGAWGAFDLRWPA